MCSASDRHGRGASVRSLEAALVALTLAGAHACARAPDADAGAPAAEATLRVCADPNNLPFSNERGEGFENALAELVARDLGRTIAYTWWPQRRGFIRTTLRAGVCDVVMGVPEGFELALTTRPYYASSYVFVTRAGRAPGLVSFDDPRLRSLAIGIHVIGDDYAQVPPGAALTARGIIANVRGYSIYGNYDRPNPPADLIAAVTRGDVDVGIAWGPLAGYFAARAPEPLRIAAVLASAAPGMTFAISMGVRRDDAALRDRLNHVINRRSADIEELLDRFHVPRADLAGSSRRTEARP